MCSVNDGFASIVLRLSIESEAMNMVEHLGAFTPHRSAPTAVRVNDRLRIVRAPAASGQMMAHAYQVALAMLAKEANMPLCSDCSKYQMLEGFIKRSLEDPKKLANKEFEVISTCVIEDLAGFMIVGRKREGGEEGEKVKGLRRTAPVWFSYLLPDQSLSSFRFEPQFHVMFNAKGENRTFIIESASAIYTLAIWIDINSIGKAPNKDGIINVVPDRDKRTTLALEAIRVMMHGQLFGAKKSRYLPRFEIVGGAASFSNPIPFMLSPPRHVPSEGSYVARSYGRALKTVEGLRRLGVTQNIYIAYFDSEGIIEGLESIVKTEGGQGAKEAKQVKKYCRAVERSNVCIEELGSFDDLIDWLYNNIIRSA